MPPEEPEQEAGRLYDAFGASLYRYALMILADRPAAEDVVQLVFVALLGRRSERIHDPEHYLRGAVRNACYSLLRRRSSRVDRFSDELLEAVPDTRPPVSPEVRLALDAAIRLLPPEQREVLHLHAFEGRTFREIAAMTGDPMNTVASRYRYAIGRLKQSLSE